MVAETRDGTLGATHAAQSCEAGGRQTTRQYTRCSTPGATALSSRLTSLRPQRLDAPEATSFVDQDRAWKKAGRLSADMGRPSRGVAHGVDWVGTLAPRTPLLELGLRGSLARIGMFLLLRLTLKQQGSMTLILDDPHTQ